MKKFLECENTFLKSYLNFNIDQHYENQKITNEKAINNATIIFKSVRKFK